MAKSSTGSQSIEIDGIKITPELTYELRWLRDFGITRAKNTISENCLYLANLPGPDAEQVDNEFLTLQSSFINVSMY